MIRIVACASLLLLAADASAQSGGQSAGSSRGRAGAALDISRQTAITSAAERVAPAVVTVQVETKSAAPADWYEMMFGRPSGERVQASIGSGFIMRADGVVVTNAHVVSGATTVSVAMRDGKMYQASVVGTDALNDVAVLRIDARNMPVAPLGNSTDVIVGEWAIAIGNPFGFVLGNAEPSVTAGVISGTGRNLLGRTGSQTGTYDMIQTDAAINPGNSGGPLVNALGEVIGMNTVIYTPSQGSVGLGFAVPINRVKRIADDLLANGVIRRPWVGIKLKEPDGNNPREAIAMGALVETVVPGSPAFVAGVRTGDQILRAGDQPVRNRFAWESLLLDLRVNEQVALELMRAGRNVNVTVKVADEPEVGAPKVQVLKDLQLIDLSSAIRVERGIMARDGAVVVQISSALTTAWGLQKGDVITDVANVPIRDADDVSEAFERLAGRGRFYLIFERNGRALRTIAQVARQ
jgi:serine protease Do